MQPLRCLWTIWTSYLKVDCEIAYALYTTVYK